MTPLARDVNPVASSPKTALKATRLPKFVDASPHRRKTARLLKERLMAATLKGDT
jgi:hypothetical protein